MFVAAVVGVPTIGRGSEIDWVKIGVGTGIDVVGGVTNVGVAVDGAVISFGTVAVCSGRRENRLNAARNENGQQSRNATTPHSR